MSDLVGNPEDRFFHNKVQISIIKQGIVAVQTGLSLGWLKLYFVAIWLILSCCQLSQEEPCQSLCHENTNVLHMRKQRRRPASGLVFAKLISAFVFAT